MRGNFVMLQRVFLSLLLGVSFYAENSGWLIAKEKSKIVDRLVELFDACEFRGSRGEKLSYRLLKPQTDNGQRDPLVVFLHGAGERGEDNRIQLIHGISEFVRPERLKKNPCWLIVPQCPKEMKWVEVDWSSPSSKMPELTSQPLQLVFELIDDMVKNGRVDAARIYITGLSMGGYGTWDALARRGNFFAAAVPICGGGDPATVERFKTVPVWCFHGDEDTAVPVARSREMIEAMRKAGGNPKYTEYPGVKHDSWTRSYENPELYEWLFAQRSVAR